MENLFEIDYGNHLSYRNVRLRFYEKLYLRLLFLKILLSVQISFFFKKKYLIRYKANSLKINKLKFLNNFVINGFLQANDIEICSLLKKRLKNFIFDLDKQIKKIPPSIREFGDCVEGLKRNIDRNLFEEIEQKFYSNKGFGEVLRNYFLEAEFKLVYLQIHINQADDEFVFKHDDLDSFDEEMNFFHVDTNLNTLKAMVYLTDVESIDNGAFEYVATSHQLFDKARFLKRLIIRNFGAYRRDLIGKKKIMSIWRSYRHKNEFSDFSKNSDLGRFINSNKVSFFGDKNIIFFNPLGIHRGGRVKEGKRIAIQLVFCPDNSWETG